MEPPPPPTSQHSAVSETDSVTPKPLESSKAPNNATLTETLPKSYPRNSVASSSSIPTGRQPQLQIYSSDLSQSTSGEIPDHELTPPSTSSAISSQEQNLQPITRPSLKPYRSVADESMADLDTHAELASGEDRNMERRESTQSSRSGSSVELAPGQKRTAGGAIKNSAVAPEHSPGKMGHARTLSSDSNSSRVAEISSQLRTRLSYAMVKVQHGWQAHNLSEVESLASQYAPSPTTTSTSFSGRKQPPISPRAEIAANLRRPGSGSSDETMGTRDFANQSYPARQANGTSQTGLKPVSSPHTSSVRTQESDLRQFSPKISQRSSQPYIAGQKPYLAPPVDIITNSRRRPAQITTNLPTSQPTVIPATPPLNPESSLSAKQRTPSQNRAMEQDAIETLLFMSSPGNSGHRPNMTDPASALTSPMRSQFSISERKVGFAEGIADSSSDEGRKRRPTKPNSRLSRQIDDLDKVLDEMEDSDDEE